MIMGFIVLKCLVFSDFSGNKFNSVGANFFVNEVSQWMRLFDLCVIPNDRPIVQCTALTEVFLTLREN